jgi:hypothetical protein
MDLIQRLCRTVLNDWKSGAVTTGTTTLLYDTVRRDEPDDYFQCTSPVSYAYILTTTDNNAPRGEDRKASDFANTGSILTVTPAFSATLNTGDTYTIIHLKRWADLKEYINMALDLIKSEVLIHTVDENSITIQSNVNEYPIPANFTHIYKVTQEDSNGNFYGAPIPSSHYSIIKSSIPLLHFNQAPESLAVAEHYYGNLWFDASSISDRHLRLEGLMAQPKLESDTDICYINPDWVVAQAGAFIHASLARRSDNEPDDHATQFKIWQTIADDIRVGRGFSTLYPPDIKRVR